MTDQPTLRPVITPAERCGQWSPGPLGAPTECVLRPGHSGSHADDRGGRWWPNPARTTPDNPLREQIARAILNAPSFEVRRDADQPIQITAYVDDLADAVLAVRDRDLRVLADEVTRLSAITGQLRALAEEHPVAIPTNLVDEALDQPAPSPAAPDELAGAYTPDPPIGCLHITAAHDSGPSVAEATADDRRYWDGEKDGE